MSSHFCGAGDLLGMNYVVYTFERRTDEALVGNENIRMNVRMHSYEHTHPPHPSPLPPGERGLSPHPLSKPFYEVVEKLGFAELGTTPTCFHEGEVECPPLGGPRKSLLYFQVVTGQAKA